MVAILRYAIRVPTSEKTTYFIPAGTDIVDTETGEVYGTLGTTPDTRNVSIPPERYIAYMREGKAIWSGYQLPDKAKQAAH